MTLQLALSSGLSNFMCTTPTPSHLNFELPKLLGALLDWREFGTSSLHVLSKAGLTTDIENITCLEDAMNDQTAKDLVHLN